MCASARTRRIESEVPVRLRGCNATSRSPLQKSVLNQERLVDFLEGPHVFADRRGNRADTHRSAIELLDDRLEDPRVHVVEPELIHFEQLERISRDLAIDAPAGAHLGEVSNSAQQPVGDARSAARSLGDLLRSILVDLDLHHLGRPVDDLLEIAGRIEVEPLLDPKPRAHRRSEHAEPSGGADQRELLDLHADCLRLGSFREADVDSPVFHRWVEEFFDDRSEPMDLIDKEDITFTEIRERADEVTRLFERRAGSRSDIHAELSRDQLGQGRLAEAWWAEEECVVEGLASGQSCIYVDAERFLHPILPDELGQSLRAERELDYALLDDDFRSCNFGAGHEHKSVVPTDLVHVSAPECLEFRLSRV